MGPPITCEEQTRSGAPAAFFPALGALEIDRAIFAPRAPATIDPSRVGDEERYPAAWGAFVHEAAHAAHSRWATPPPQRGTALDHVAQMLEESRAEQAHLARRPDDRRFLRACVNTLVMGDITRETPSDRWRAAFAAGLILARRDAGILDEDETEPLHRTVESILGTDLLAALAASWKEAHTSADDDAATMVALARAWCEVLGSDHAAPQPSPDSQNSCRKGELAAAVDKVFSVVAANEATQAAAHARAEAARAARRQAKAEEAARQRQAAQMAAKVFTPQQRPFTPKDKTPKDKSTGRRATSPITGTRAPSAREKAAAGQLARALRAAAYRERTAVTTTSASPPGRLNMRGALARDAQKAAGALPTAQPWVHTRHRQDATPPLRVGIAWTCPVP